VTWSIRFAETAPPALDVSAGQVLVRAALLRVNVFTRPRRTSRSLGAGLEVPARHQARVRGRRIEPTALLGFLPFAGLLPMPGAAMSPLPRACVPFVVSLAAIYFRRGTVRPESRRMQKGRTIVSAATRASRLAPVTDPCRTDVSPPRPILPWALPLSGFGRHKDASARARPHVDH